MWMKDKIGSFLRKFFWLECKTPDADSDRSLNLYFPKRKYRWVSILRWKKGQMDWLEKFLAKSYIWPEY